MAQAKVSVIIPVYNTEKYVEEALRSIMSQSLEDIEIIVINDGSTDNSLELIRGLAASDKRIQLHCQENKGLSESRNLGIKAATGEYIYFMDSDDLLERDGLLDCYKKCQDKNLDFIFFDAKIFGHSNGSPVINYQRTHLLEDRVYGGPEILEKLLKKAVFLSSACLNFIELGFLRQIQLQFYPGILHEDELFTLLLFLQAERVSFLPFPYFQRRIRDDSIMTSRFARKNATGYFTVAREIIQFRNETNDPSIRSLIDRRLRAMFQAVLYKTRSMKMKDRIFVLFNCALRFKKYVTLKDLILAGFPISNLMKGSKNIPLENKTNHLLKTKS